MEIKFVRLSKEAILPKQSNDKASGFDLYSLDKIVIPPHTFVTVFTGIAIELPENYEAQIRSRSGMASRGIYVLNSPGTIDNDYRGEIGVVLHNVTSEPYYIQYGDRIAQMVICPVVYASKFNVIEISKDQMSQSERGNNGFGSTGK